MVSAMRFEWHVHGVNVSWLIPDMLLHIHKLWVKHNATPDVKLDKRQRQACNIFWAWINAMEKQVKGEVGVRDSLAAAETWHSER